MCIITEVADIFAVTLAELDKLLGSHSLQIQRPIDRLRKTATGIAVGLALVHLGMFILMYSLLKQQTALVSPGAAAPPHHWFSSTARSH
jgi:hypothetical protein